MKGKTKKILPFFLFITCVIVLTGCGKKTDLELYEMETTFEQSTKEPPDTEITEYMDSTDETEQKSVYVDVCGAVLSPGVYELPYGSRVYEAILLAGGVTEEADEKAVNQAALLSDGMQLYVPKEGETGAWEAAEAGEGMSADDKVNLNTADVGELTTLPGIGEARARDIIAYRDNHGGFSSIQEIKEVSGIKDAVFEKIKEKIKVQ